MPRARQSRDANVSFFAFQDIITAVTGILILIVILMVLMLRQPGVVEKIQTEPVETRTLDEIETLITQALEKIREMAQQRLPSPDATEASLLVEIEDLEAQLGKESDPLRAALLTDVEATIVEVENLKANLSDLDTRKNAITETLKETEATVESRASFVEESRNGDQIWLRMAPSDKKPIIVELDHVGAVLRDHSDPGFSKRLSTGEMVAELRSIAQGLDGLESYFVFFIRPSGAGQLEPLQTMLIEEGIDLGYRPLGEEIELEIYEPEAEVFDE